jgi:hypothetical protein
MVSTGLDLASTIAVSASAVATAAMAIYTARLASKTKSLSDSAEKEAAAVVEQGKSIALQASAVGEQARAAGEQLALTRETLRASVQPWLTTGKSKQTDDLEVLASGGIVSGESPAFRVALKDNHLYVALVVRNVGSGLAIIDPQSSHVVGWPSQNSLDTEPMNYSSGRIENPILPAREEIYVLFDVDLFRWMNDFETVTGQRRNDGEFFVDIVYGDILGLERTRARFHAYRDKSRNFWSIFEIHYFAPPDATDATLHVRF